MDQKEDCGQVRRPKHDVVEGDVFVVRSDGYNGKGTQDQRQPAECSVGFNFGDRLLSVSVVDWTCDQPYTEPFLSVYADCDGRRKTLLVRTSYLVPGTAGISPTFRRRFVLTVRHLELYTSRERRKTSRD